MTRPHMTRLQTIWQLELVLLRLREELIFVVEETERLLERPWAQKIPRAERDMMCRNLDAATNHMSFVTGYVGGVRLRLKEEKKNERPQKTTTPVE